MSAPAPLGTSAPAPRRRLGFAAFRQRDFAVYLAGSLCGNLAIQMQAAALFWQVYDLTGSTLALALIGLMEFLPAPLLLALSGPVADRVERRLIVQRGYFVLMIGALMLLWLSLGQPARIWPFFVVAFLVGCVRAFLSPAGRAIVPSIVPPEVLGNAIAWRSTSFQTAIIGGPVAAGLLYGFGPALVYGVVAACMIVASATMFFVSRRPAAKSGERPGWASLYAGLRFIRGQPVLLGAISLDLFAVLFGGATALLPVYAKDILQVGPAEYGFLRAAASCGGLAMALTLAVRPLRRQVGRTMFVAVTVFGFATIVFGLSTSYVLSLIALAILGAADMISVFVRSNVVPLTTPNQMLGRVTAVEMVFIGASNELGTFESGAVAWLIGPVATVVLGGVATLAIVGLWIRLFPALYRFDRLE